MRSLHLFFFACVAAGVTGKGYRAAYEKVFLFYAFGIDQLNPEDQRVIGFKCASVIDDEKGGCNDVKPKYIPCTAVDKKYDPASKKMVETTRGCKNLKEFLSHIDKADWSKTTPVPGGKNAQDTWTPDVDGTARRLNDLKMDQNRYPAWRVIKDGTSFNKMIQDVTDAVAKTKASMRPEDYESRKAQFEGLNYSLKQVGRMRYIDHSHYLIERLKQEIPGIEIKSHATGLTQWVNEGSSKREVESFEFLRQETIDANKKAIPDIENKMKTVYDAFYTDDVHAREHKIVMDSFEMSLNKIEGTSCSV